MNCHGCKIHLSEHPENIARYYLTLSATENPHYNNDAEDKKGMPIDSDKLFCDIVCLRDWVAQFMPASVV